MAKLWIWGEIENIQDILSEYTKKTRSAPQFHVSTHRFEVQKHVRYALFALKCYFYAKFALKYPIYNQFINIHQNLGFELNFVYREGKIFVHVEVMEMDFGEDVDDSSLLIPTPTEQSSTRGTDALRMRWSAESTPPQHWIITPFGLPAKVVKQTATHVHVKMSSMQQQLIIFRRDEVRHIAHKHLPHENNAKILKKILQLLRLNDTQQNGVFHIGGSNETRHPNGNISNNNSTRNHRKRKRHTAIDGVVTQDNSTSQTSSTTSNDSLQKKKQKTCRDIFESFDISTTNKNSLTQNNFPPAINFDITQYEALASFLGSMDTTNVGATSDSTTTPPPIPDFTETQEEQLRALRAYFPQYQGGVPTTITETEVEDSLLVDDVVDAKVDDLAEDIDDFDKLWDEEEDKVNEPAPAEPEQPTGPSPAEEQMLLKQTELKRLLLKQINDFHGDQSKHAANAFAEFMTADSDMVNDTNTILNPIIAPPHDEPLVFPPNPFNSIMQDSRAMRNQMRQNEQIFGIPKEFRSNRPPINADNMVFDASAYTPNFLVDSGTERYCSIQSFMVHVEECARDSRHQLSGTEEAGKQATTAPKFLDTFTMTESDRKQADEDDEVEVFVTEPSLLETVSLYLQVLGQGRHATPSNVLHLLHKTRDIVAQCSPGEESHSFLLLFGEFTHEDDTSILSTQKLHQQQYNFELIQIHALGQNMANSTKMRCTSGEKLMAALTFLTDELNNGLLGDAISLRGPLLLEDDACSIAHISYLGVPLLRIGFTDHWLDTSPEAMNYWEKMLLQPFAPRKRLRYLMITHNGDQDQNRLFANVLRDLSIVFRLCQLGSHLPVREDENIQNGIFQMDLSALVSNHDSADSLKHFFVTVFQRKIRETMMTLKKYISSAAEKDEIIVVYFINPLPELLTRIILQTLEIPTDDWPVVIHVIDEDKLKSIYDRNPLEELKELAMEVFNKCRSSQKFWMDVESSYFSRMYEPALVLSPPSGIESPSSAGTDLSQSASSTQHGITIHFAYRIYERFVLCTWTDSAGQILESTVLTWSRNWKKEVCRRPLTFLSASPANVAASFVVCKYGTQMQSEECEEWRKCMASEGIRDRFERIEIVSLELDSSMQVLLDSARLVYHPNAFYPKDAFHGSVLVVPSGVSVSTASGPGKQQQECHILSSLSINPFEAKLSQSINIDNQRFQSYVITLHDRVEGDAMKDDSSERGVKHIGEEMHKMSWLSCSPSNPQRKSILPLHVQLIDSIEGILRAHFHS